MLNAAAKAGVPSVRMTTLNKAMCAYDRKHKAPLYALDAPAGTLFATYAREGVGGGKGRVANSAAAAGCTARFLLLTIAGTRACSFWDEVLPDDAAKVADSETIAERVVRDNAQETAEQR